VSGAPPPPLPIKAVAVRVVETDGGSAGERSTYVVSDPGGAMAERREGTDMLEQLGDELKLQAWLAGAELRHPSLADPSLREEVDGLARLRDELRLQLHLGKLEARDEFEHLEGRWRRIMQGAAETASDAAHSIRDLVHEIREGYRRMRQGSAEKPEEPTGA
jgi:hypothetical protein